MADLEARLARVLDPDAIPAVLEILSDELAARDVTLARIAALEDDYEHRENHTPGYEGYRTAVREILESSPQTRPVDPQARAILEDWLEDDNHGLRIPGTEWGISLAGALRRVLYSPQVSGRAPRTLTEATS